MARGDLKQKLKWVLLGLLFLVIFGYAYAKTNAVRQGVILSVTGVTDGETVTDGTLHIEGTATNASSLSLDDRPIVIDLKGAFAEQLLLQPGYNIISMKAEDRFGKKTEKIFHVVYLAPTADIIPPSPTPDTPDQSVNGIATDTQNTATSGNQDSTN